MGVPGIGYTEYTSSCGTVDAAAPIFTACRSVSTYGEQ